jgi:hypothetical protein
VLLPVLCCVVLCCVVLCCVVLCCVVLCCVVLCCVVLCCVVLCCVQYVKPITSPLTSAPPPPVFLQVLAVEPDRPAMPGPGHKLTGPQGLNSCQVLNQPLIYAAPLPELFLQVLAVAPDRPTIPAPGHKLTAANTCAHWLASTSSSSSSFSSTGVNTMSLQLTASPLHASSWPAAVGVAADACADLDSTAMLGRPLSGLSAMEQELAALLDICMAEMSAVGVSCPSCVCACVSKEGGGAMHRLTWGSLVGTAHVVPAATSNSTHKGWVRVSCCA